MNQFLLFLLITVAASRPVFAAKSIADRCSTLLDIHTQSDDIENVNSGATEPWPYLRKNSLLVSQKEQGLCGPICAINISQAVIRASEAIPFENPKLVMTEAMEKLKVRPLEVDTSKIIEMLKYFQIKRLNKTGRVTAILIPKTNTAATDEIKIQNGIMFSDIAVENGKLKILLSGQFNSFGELAFAHAQILKNSLTDTITIIDPNAPMVDYTAERDGLYTLNGVTVPRFRYSWNNKPAGLSGFVPYGIIEIEKP